MCESWYKISRLIIQNPLYNKGNISITSQDDSQVIVCFSFFKIKEVKKSMKFVGSIHRIQVNTHTENISDRCNMDNTDYEKRFASKLMNILKCTFFFLQCTGIVTWCVYNFLSSIKTP